MAKVVSALPVTYMEEPPYDCGDEDQYRQRRDSMAPVDMSEQAEWNTLVYTVSPQQLSLEMILIQFFVHGMLWAVSVSDSLTKVRS